MSLTVGITVLVLQWSVLAAIMATASAIERRTGNSGYVDTIWSLGVGLTGALFALWPLDGETGTSSRQIAVTAMSAIWGLRLGLHILQRSRGRPEDPRYADLIKQWGSNAPREMFMLLQKQAVVAVPLVAGIFWAAHNPAPSLAWQDVLAAGVFLIAVAGETVSDRQLRAFVADPANRGRICDAGLWRYSRHPNYFFEWLTWTVYPIAAINLDGKWPIGWLALLAPLTMYWLLVHVSGVPPLEQHMLRKHGDRFRAYQARTNAFFPGPPKHV